MLKKIITITLVVSTIIFYSNTYADADKGKPLDISVYKGKVVLVDFWASWCAPCRKSFPWLNEMQNKFFNKGLIILGVNVDESSSDAQQFLKQNPAIFKILYDPQGQYASYYKLPGMPTTLIFNRQGNLQYQHVGFKLNKVKEYEQQINQALKF